MHKKSMGSSSSKVVLSRQELLAEIARLEHEVNTLREKKYDDIVRMTFVPGTTMGYWSNKSTSSEFTVLSVDDEKATIGVHKMKTTYVVELSTLKLDTVRKTVHVILTNNGRLSDYSEQIVHKLRPEFVAMIDADKRQIEATYDKLERLRNDFICRFVHVGDQIGDVHVVHKYRDTKEGHVTWVQTHNDQFRVLTWEHIVASQQPGETGDVPVEDDEREEGQTV